MTAEGSIFMFFMFARTLLAVECKIVTSTPSNGVAAIGSEVSFQCKTDNPTTIRWNFYAPGQDRPLRIHTGTMLNNKLKETFQESFEAGCSTLTIKFVRENNTGTFSCFEQDTSEYRINFTLQVQDFSTSIWSTPRTTESLANQYNSIISHGYRSTGIPADDELVKPVGSTTGVLSMEFASLLVVCLMVVVVFVFVTFMKRNRGNTATGSANESDSRSSTGRSRRSRRSKFNVSGQVAEIDEFSYVDAAGRPSSLSNPSSEDGHYSEVIETDSANVETSAGVHNDGVGYEGLDPAVVLEIPSRPPAVYDDLASMHDTDVSKFS